MRYDELGFPIPPDFTGRPHEESAGSSRRRTPRRPAAPGRGKRIAVLALLAALIGGTLVGPMALPAARDVVVRWSVQRAFDREARGQSAAAIGDVGRALAWNGDDAHRAVDLLCWRSTLRLNAGDPAAAAADASRAMELMPLAVRPRQVRALTNVVLARPDEALADAEAAVQLAGPADPEALNLRAYVRALVGRELPAALADVEAVLAGDTDPAAEMLDTRGFVLHLLGRHAEAIDDLNRAIQAVEDRRRRLVALAGHADRVDLARELRSMDRDLAVMHQHRGLACRAAGLERQAEQDLAIAAQKGFDPDRGVM